MTTSSSSFTHWFYETGHPARPEDLGIAYSVAHASHERESGFGEEAMPPPEEWLELIGLRRAVPGDDFAGAKVRLDRLACKIRKTVKVSEEHFDEHCTQQQFADTLRAIVDGIYDAIGE